MPSGRPSSGRGLAGGDLRVGRRRHLEGALGRLQHVGVEARAPSRSASICAARSLAAEKLLAFRPSRASARVSSVRSVTLSCVLAPVLGTPTRVRGVRPVESAAAAIVRSWDAVVCESRRPTRRPSARGRNGPRWRARWTTTSPAQPPSVTPSSRFFIAIGVTEVIGSTPVTSTSSSCSTKARMALSSPCSGATSSSLTAMRARCAMRRTVSGRPTCCLFVLRVVSDDRRRRRRCAGPSAAPGAIAPRLRGVATRAGSRPGSDDDVVRHSPGSRRDAGGRWGGTAPGRSPPPGSRRRASSISLCRASWAPAGVSGREHGRRSRRHRARRRGQGG